ncbi:hypothetical protein [Streptomyces sp. NPDC017940]|uniref:hypothetical protein n=1 Tax=Streptomyces sp. NPDC017940 TaxID=3365017 RepID=UPI0037ACA85D
MPAPTRPGRRRWTPAVLATSTLLLAALALPTADAAPQHPAARTAWQTAAAAPQDASGKTRHQTRCVRGRLVCLAVTTHTKRIQHPTRNTRAVSRVDVRRYKGFTRSRTYYVRWAYKRPGGSVHTSRWQRATNYNGTAVHWWDYQDGIDVRRGGRVCGQVKGHNTKACVTLR